MDHLPFLQAQHPDFESGEAVVTFDTPVPTAAHLWLLYLTFCLRCSIPSEGRLSLYVCLCTCGDRGAKDTGQVFPVVTGFLTEPGARGLGCLTVGRPGICLSILTSPACPVEGLNSGLYAFSTKRAVSLVLSYLYRN